MPTARLYLDYTFFLEEDGSIVINDLEEPQLEHMEIKSGDLFEAVIDHENKKLRFQRKS